VPFVCCAYSDVTLYVSVCCVYSRMCVASVCDRALRMLCVFFCVLMCVCVVYLCVCIHVSVFMCA